MVHGAQRPDPIRDAAKAASEIAARPQRHPQAVRDPSLVDSLTPRRTRTAPVMLSTGSRKRCSPSVSPETKGNRSSTRRGTRTHVHEATSMARAGSCLALSRREPKARMTDINASMKHAEALLAARERRGTVHLNPPKATVNAVATANRRREREPTRSDHLFWRLKTRTETTPRAQPARRKKPLASAALPIGGGSGPNHFTFSNHTNDARRIPTQRARAASHRAVSFREIFTGSQASKACLTLLRIFHSREGV